MKKLFILLFFLFLTAFNKGYCTLTIQSVGGTTINPTTVSTPIQVSINTLISITLNMKVTALDQYVTNTTNSNYKIPISQLYLNDGAGEFQMQYNTPVSVLSGISVGIGTYSKNYTCIMKGLGVLPPGTYKTRLKFDTLNLLIPLDSTTFTLTFTIPYDQDVTTITNPVNITLTQDNVFDTTAVVDNTVTPQINIKSNGKWKLIMSTNTLGALKGDYFFTITEVSSNVTNYINSQTQILPNQQYVLASGKPTVSVPVTGSYVTDYIKLKYTMKNNSGVVIPDGAYNNFTVYTIQQGDI